MNFSLPLYSALVFNDACTSENVHFVYDGDNLRRVDDVKMKFVDKLVDERPHSK